jgi:hypothetical protein
MTDEFRDIDQTVDAGNEPLQAARIPPLVPTYTAIWPTAGGATSPPPGNVTMGHVGCPVRASSAYSALDAEPTYTVSPSTDTAGVARTVPATKVDQRTTPVAASRE